MLLCEIENIQIVRAISRGLRYLYQIWQSDDNGPCTRSNFGMKYDFR